jgi:hypothetical protein
MPDISTYASIMTTHSEQLKASGENDLLRGMVVGPSSLLLLLTDGRSRSTQRHLLPEGGVLYTS